MDKKLTDNEIIKALECCMFITPNKKCNECPKDNEGVECSVELHRHALDIIHRQQTNLDDKEETIQFADKEIKRLNAEIERLKLESVQSQNTRINELELKLLSSEGLRNEQEKEIEQLRRAIAANNKELDRWSEIVCEKNEEINILHKDALEEIKTSKSEAIKEFAERVKKYRCVMGCGYDVVDVVNKLVKEMTEQNDFNRKG